MLDAGGPEQVFLLRPRAECRWTTARSFGSSDVRLARSCSGSAGPVTAARASAACRARPRRARARSGAPGPGTVNRSKAGSITAIASVTVVVASATRRVIAWRITLLVFLPRWHACVCHSIRRRRFPARSRSTATSLMTHAFSTYRTPRPPPTFILPAAASASDRASQSPDGLAAAARAIAMITHDSGATPAPDRDRGAP